MSVIDTRNLTVERWIELLSHREPRSNGNNGDGTREHTAAHREVAAMRDGEQAMDTRMEKIEELAAATA